ncbi:PHD finger protein 23B-like isoform X2 [Haliotis rubra]|uniref:PHD finger protein 23B-like isoform X2 n=1 Tax=Haliotis rubra TaxID=36100 RepID=UPI001EE59FA0|nr:PHD finger protein 23B-like isoform X2 [Haliotis rubra]
MRNGMSALGSSSLKTFICKSGCSQVRSAAACHECMRNGFPFLDGYDCPFLMEMRSTDNVSPLDSGGSTAESYEAESTESANSTMSLSESEHYGSRDDSEPEDDSHELITCFCLKPYAGRPMIECNECLTWIHLSCAKIRKTNIPEDFTCQRCRDAKFTTRKSTRMRIESKRIST